MRLRKNRDKGSGEPEQVEDTERVLSDDEDARVEDARVEDGARAASRLVRVIDNAVRFEGRRAADRVTTLRRRHPRESPERVLERLEKAYLRSVSRLGGAVGATAAVPVLGTGAAVALTGAQLASFVEASARYVLSVAEVHGVTPEDIERRRTLVLGVLLGEEGARAVSSRLGLGTLHWARGAIGRVPMTTVRAVNRRLTGRLVRFGASRGLGTFAGRLAPFGIGAVIGYRGTRAMGEEIVDGARKAFGPAPRHFTIDAEE